MTKALSTQTIEWPKLGFVLEAGVETELPTDKDAQEIILAHPDVKKVGAKNEQKPQVETPPASAGD